MPFTIGVSRVRQFFPCAPPHDHRLIHVREQNTRAYCVPVCTLFRRYAFKRRRTSSESSDRTARTRNRLRPIAFGPVHSARLVKKRERLRYVEENFYVGPKRAGKGRTSERETRENERDYSEGERVVPRERKTQEAVARGARGEGEER